MKYLIILILLSSCSAKWHFQKAYQKDPSIFKVDTTTKIISLNAPTSKFKLDTPCITRPIEFFEIREIKSKGKTLHDTIFVRLKPDTIEVECDPILITETIPEPYPVEIDKPIIKSIKDIQWQIIGALCLIFGIVFMIKKPL